MLLVSGTAGAAATQVSGRVFDDANSNGKQDSGEHGVEGVGVSDGIAITWTDDKGLYRLDATSGGGQLFVIKPAGWQVGVLANGLPGFWQSLPAPQTSELPSVDFPLQREPPSDQDLDVLVFADPQPKTVVDVGFYQRDIVEPLQGKTSATLGLTLGDIVNDDQSLYPQINAATTSLGIPWLHVPGNHDRDHDAASDADSLRTYHHAFGPDTFAWEESNANFVMLDDVIQQDDEKKSYIGGFRAEQFTFLETYLAHARKDRLLVLAFHIPLFDQEDRDTFRDADRERLFSLLLPFQHVLILSAHSHTQQHWYHDASTGWHGKKPLHEYNVGAACGAYWSGVKDAEGIPDSTMADGTPNGYATMRVAADGSYSLAWHPARLGQDDASRTQAMSLHAPKVLRAGAYPAWGIYANVYMGQDDTRVEYRVDAGDWRPMKRVLVPDPGLQVENMRDDLATTLRGFDRSPEATPSFHLWRGALPTNLAPGMHAVDVRAFDEWRGEQRASTTYQLQAAVE